MAKRFHQTFVAFLFLLLGCSNQSSEKPSYLIIAVEKLPFAGIICSQSVTEDQSKEAFDLLCNEAIRFTHMFTPSTQSQAALTSVLTGLYPSEHKVWHNGNVYLAENTTSAAEVFYQKGYRTSFFSGGGGIWRKSGLAQGFTYFDDSFPVHWTSYYRPARNSFATFLRWLDDKPEAPFFSVVYIPDLAFPSIATKDEEGLKRESSYDGQYTALLEALGFISSSLKKRERWHNTNIIVLGLNGRGDAFRKNELDAYNLNSENTRVAFYYKPNGKKRDLGQSWKVDYNYSLTDLGFSFFTELQQQPNESMFIGKNILSKSYTEEDTNRWMMIESAWPHWKGFSSSRFSLRKADDLFIFDDKIIYYNNLIDQLEMNPQPIQWNEVKDVDLQSWIQSLNIRPWQGIDSNQISKWKLARRLWDPFDLEQNPQEFLQIYESTQDMQVLQWLATLALKREKWTWLLEAGTAAKNSNWIFVAKYNLGTLTQEDWKILKDPCFLLFLQEDHPVKSRLATVTCNDTEIDLLYKWVTEKNAAKEQIREQFVRQYLEKNISDNIHKLNYLADLSWDISLQYPAGPSLSDLILSLNKYRTYYTVIKRRMELVQYEKVVY